MGTCRAMVGVFLFGATERRHGTGGRCDGPNLHTVSFWQLLCKPQALQNPLWFMLDLLRGMLLASRWTKRWERGMPTLPLSRHTLLPAVQFL